MSYSPSSGTATPTTESTSTLTKAGVSAIISHPTTGALPQSQTQSQEDVSLPDLDASKLTITYTKTPKPTITPNDPRIPAQNLATDHMLQIPWSLTSGWSNPTIVPYGPLPLDPAASCLHYATECFEGMKMYRSPHDGKLRLFRPNLNARRFLKSATRIALPAFSPSEFLKCLSRFVELEGEKWLPDTPEWRGRCLYLRPTMIGTGNRLGVQRPENALLYVIAVFMPDMAASPTGLRLLASRHDMIRAWPGGFGFAKVGANYGPTLVAQGEARSRGYTQVLWLFGEEGYVTEAGAANFFVLWEREGKLELVTPPLDDGTILEGVTRGSVLGLVRGGAVKGVFGGEEVIVSERNIRMSEILQASKEGRLRESFACGTAFFVAGIGEIDFRGETVVLPIAKGKESKFTAAVKSQLEDIMYGKVQHEWGYVVGKSQ